MQFLIEVKGAELSLDIVAYRYIIYIRALYYKPPPQLGQAELVGDFL